MAKLIKPEEFGALIVKKQGDLSDVAFAASLGMARQSLRALKMGKYLPPPKMLAKFGLELVYRVKPPSAPAKPVTKPKKAAKK